MVTLISEAKMYGCRPSELFDIEDAYTAYCLDEACAYIRSKIENGETPVFERKFKSFHDIYKQYGV